MTNVLKQNPIGQIADSVVEQLKSTGSQAATQLTSEPAKILEHILGGVNTPPPTVESGETAIEQGQQTATTANDPTVDTSLLQRKKQESQETAAALYKLHQQRLQEEKQYYQEHKREEAQQKQVEAHEESQKQEIVQLKKEREDEVAWQQQIKAVQGSHEGQQGKM